MKSLNEKIWKEEQLESTNLSIVGSVQSSTSGGKVMIVSCTVPMGLSCGDNIGLTHNIYLCNFGFPNDKVYSIDIGKNTTLPVVGGIGVKL